MWNIEFSYKKVCYHINVFYHTIHMNKIVSCDFSQIHLETASFHTIPSYIFMRLTAFNISIAKTSSENKPSKQNKPSAVKSEAAIVDVESSAPGRALSPGNFQHFPHTCGECWTRAPFRMIIRVAGLKFRSKFNLDAGVIAFT